MIARMAKIEIVGPKKLLTPTIDAIHNFGKFQVCRARFADIADFADQEKVDLDPDQIRYKKKLEDLLARTEEILNLAAETPSLFAKGDKDSDEDSAAFLSLDEASMDGKIALFAELHQKIKGLIKKKLDLKDEFGFVGRYKKVIEAFVPMLEGLSNIRSLDVVGFTMKKKMSDVLDLLSRELKVMTGGHYDIFTRELDENTLAGVVAVPREHHREVRRLFVSESISELRLPDSFGKGAPIETLNALSKRLADIPGEMDAVDDEVHRLMAGHSPDLFVKLHALAEDRISEISAVAQAAHTRMTFILLGWVPERHLAEFMDFAKANLDPSLIVNRRTLGHHDLESGQIPVIIENPPLIRPFELCLKLLPGPSYASVDPTPFLAFFFPMFFGLILGDIAYGLVLIGLSIFIHYRFRQYVLAQSVSVILFACATSTVLFGFLFGEFFGDLGHRWGILRPILMNRETAILPTLFLAVGMGVGHILLGFLIKAYNSLRWKEYGHAVEALSTVLLLISLGVFIGGLTGLLPPMANRAGIVAMVLLIPVLIASGGVIAILEIFGAVGNILSYARIMAIGLSSVILAVVANKLAGRFGNVVLGGIIAVLVHLINLVLGVFGPTVHSLRLHYVEFFSKFYKTGSVVYRPLTKKSRNQTALEGGS